MTASPGTPTRWRRGPMGAALPSIRACLLLAGTAAGADAQSLLRRTPNLSRAWVGLPSTPYLDYLHRFDASEAGAAGDTPALFAGWGVGGYALLGVHWARIDPPGLAADDEWELVARLSPLSTEVGAPVDVGLTAAWNDPAGSLDGELTVGVPVGPGTLLAVVRGFSDGWGDDDSEWAVGAGAILPLGDAAAFAADLVRPTSLGPGEEIGWGAALQLAVPRTPATLSLQAANTRSPTLQGSSRRFGGTRWGVQLSLPLQPSRYFADGDADPGARTGEVAVVAADTARIAMTDTGFREARVEVAAGTSVVWTNDGEEIHAAVADAGTWESPLMAPGESFGRVFTEAGEHPYHCRLHPSETGIVVVR